MSDFHKRLAEMGLQLPTPPRPVAAYVPWRAAGDLIFVSGQMPMVEGVLMATGTVPSQVPVDEAQLAARQCVLNGLAVISDALGGQMDRLKEIIRLGVYVASEKGFTDQPLVANGASELLVDLLGDRGRHARAAVGSVALPLNAPVEVEMVVTVSG